MTLVVSVIQLSERRLWSLSAAHPSVGVLRPGPGADVEHSLKLVARKPGRGLGEVSRAELARELSVESYELKPGDLLLWHTDGLLERRLRSGRDLTRLELFRSALRLGETAEAPVDAQCDRLLGELLPAAAGGPAPDDVTLILGSVPLREIAYKDSAGR
jgi:serine phosphatase RsbU (regulator of sigma subunit)